MQAAFIPSPDSAHDTSYFASRYTWNSNDGRFETDPNFVDESDNESTSSGSTSDSDARPEEAVRLKYYSWCGLAKLKLYSVKFTQWPGCTVFNYILLSNALSSK